MDNALICAALITGEEECHGVCEWKPMAILDCPITVCSRPAEVTNLIVKSVANTVCVTKNVPPREYREIPWVAKLSEQLQDEILALTDEAWNVVASQSILQVRGLCPAQVSQICVDTTTRHNAELGTG